jgi:aldehyde oxidoreductase
VTQGEPVAGANCLVVNGIRHEVGTSPADTVLADFLRDEAGCTEVKVACGEGACGACTVLVDRRAVLACLTPLHRVAGRKVATVAHCAADPLGAAIIEAFVAHRSFQCGYCTPGWVVTAYGLLSERRDLPPERRRWIEDQCVGHLCRCTGYGPILAAIEEVALDRAPLEGGAGHALSTCDEVSVATDIAGTGR